MQSFRYFAVERGMFYLYGSSVFLNPIGEDSAVWGGGIESSRGLLTGASSHLCTPFYKVLLDTYDVKYERAYKIAMIICQ